MAAGDGDLLPVSALPPGGTFPTGTAKWEKRNIAQFIPVWDQDLCIQCGKCVMVCPHAVIRAKVYDSTLLPNAPATFKSAKPKWRGMDNELYTLQVSPEDCTGCQLCVEVCPAKSKSDPAHKALNMAAQQPLRLPERANWEFFETLPTVGRDRLSLNQVKDIQLLEPLFEFSGACSGCGETPYIKLLTQLFGDRLMIANATGCSSIYGGNLPTTPYCRTKKAAVPPGPTPSSKTTPNSAWACASRSISRSPTPKVSSRNWYPSWAKTSSAPLSKPTRRRKHGINAQRERIRQIRAKLATVDSADARNLSTP